MSHILKYTLWLIGLLVIAGIAGFLFLNFSRPTTTPKVSATQQLLTARQTGDYSAAVAQYQSILADPSASTEQKAIATYIVAGAQFHLSGNINDVLQSVQDLKQVILDQTVSLQTRVAALNTLAATYSDVGSNQSVFTEIFKGTPFSSYLAPGNPTLSVRNLYEWSYSLLPTPEAAVHLAKLYSDPHPQVSASTTQALTAKAEDYLDKANTAALQRGQTDPTYLNSAQYYVEYQFWRAVTIGRLARENIAPYTTEYRSEFGQYINFAQTSQDLQGKENLYYARYYYAETLSVDNDTADAKQQLDLLAQELNALPNPNVTSFVLFLRSNYKNQKTALNWTVIQNLMSISPNFKSTANNLFSSSTSTSTTGS